MLRNGIMLLVVSFCTFSAVSQNQDKDIGAIHALLAKQAKEWNRGDLHGFMQTYWNNDSLMFAGKTGMTFGWQNALNNYTEHYPDKTVMGKLDFQLVQVRRLSADYFSVAGKWHLGRRMGDLAGVFTLLIRKIDGRWLIVADHSS